MDSSSSWKVVANGTEMRGILSSNTTDQPTRWTYTEPSASGATSWTTDVKADPYWAGSNSTVAAPSAPTSPMNSTEMAPSAPSASVPAAETVVRQIAADVDAKAKDAFASARSDATPPVKEKDPRLEKEIAVAQAAVARNLAPKPSVSGSLQPEEAVVHSLTDTWPKREPEWLSAERNWLREHSAKAGTLQAAAAPLPALPKVGAQANAANVASANLASEPATTPELSVPDLAEMERMRIALRDAEVEHRNKLDELNAVNQDNYEQLRKHMQLQIDSLNEKLIEAVKDKSRVEAEVRQELSNAELKVGELSGENAALKERLEHAEAHSDTFANLMNRTSPGSHPWCQLCDKYKSR